MRLPCSPSPNIQIEQSLAEVSQALLARRQSGVVQSDETVDRIQQSIDEINAIREKLEATMSKDSLSAVDGKNYFMHPATLTTQARIEAEREYQRSSREAFAWWLKVLPELSDPNDAVPVEHITVREFQLAHDALRRARGEQI